LESWGKEVIRHMLVKIKFLGEAWHLDRWVALDLSQTGFEKGIITFIDSETICWLVGTLIVYPPWPVPSGGGSRDDMAK
jgi:hypothetical protein